MSVVCITGPSRDLKHLLVDLEECMLSGDAQDSFFNAEDEEFVFVDVYTPSGNKAKSAKWLFSRMYIQGVVLARSGPVYDHTTPSPRRISPQVKPRSKFAPKDPR